MKQLVPFYNGVEIHKDSEGRISLTDLHKASGATKGMNPAKWQETLEAQAFIKATTKILNIPGADIIKSKKGKGGGTYAHEQIALEYAQYLSPELAVAVNQVFFERLEEEKNPQLAIDRGVKGYKKQGRSEAWIAERLSGTAARLAFTKTLAQHGVKGIGFKDCTNAIYHHLYGGGADKVREKKNLPLKANTREHMTETELAAVRLAELLASDNIKAKNLQGNKACEYECSNTSRLVARTVMESRKTHSTPLAA